jgi:hypothetical protein
MRFRPSSKRTPARALSAAAGGLALVFLAGCSADGRTCYTAVEREYGQIMKAVPCESASAESG